MTETNRNEATTGQDMKKKIDEQLKLMGSSKAKFNKAKKAYDSLKGQVRCKADFEQWLTFGEFAVACKEHLKSIKNNPNSGLFGEFAKLHFPDMNSQDLSNAQWLFNNRVAVGEYFVESGKYSTNPASAKQSIRKALGEIDYQSEQAEKDAYDKYGMKPPKSKPKKVENELNNDNDEKTINRKNLDKLTATETLAWMKALYTRLNTLKGNSTSQFSDLDINEIQQLSLDLADMQVHIKDKQKAAASKKAA